MIFRKPIDADRDRTEEERAEQLARFRENDFSREDERALIRAALRTFLPAVIGVGALFALVAFALVKLWN